MGEWKRRESMEEIELPRGPNTKLEGVDYVCGEW